MPKVPRPPVLLTVKQTAESLQTLPDTVRKLIRRGKLKAYRLGDKGSELRIPIHAVYAFLEGSLLGAEYLARMPTPMRRRVEETERANVAIR